MEGDALKEWIEQGTESFAFHLSPEQILNKNNGGFVDCVKL